MPSSLCPAPKQVLYLEGPRIAAYLPSWGWSQWAEDRGPVRGRAEARSFSRGANHTSKPVQLGVGLTPGEDLPSLLAMLTPEKPSTLSLTKKSIIATFLILGLGSGSGHSLA